MMIKMKEAKLTAQTMMIRMIRKKENLYMYIQELVIMKMEIMKISILKNMQ